VSEGQVNGRSRRAALRGGFGAIAGVAMIWIAPVRVRAASDKLAKATVQYTDSGNVAGKDCDDCSQFVAGKTARDPASCKIVEGVINPHGHCIAFTPKPKS
jgi:hypothetical protein